MSEDLPVKLRGKKEMHRHWKQGQVSWEEYRDSVWLCKSDIRKAKEHLELNLLRDAKVTGRASIGVSARKESSKKPSSVSHRGKLI